MTEERPQRQRQVPIQCCTGLSRTVHIVQPETRYTARILDNKQAEFQSHMIEVEGMINNQPLVILIDSGASHNYVDPRVV
jgi:hypothetical protein